MTTIARVQSTGDLLLAGEIIEGYKQLVLRDHPVLYMRLDETSGTVAHDISGHNNNGTITGGVTLDQPGALIDGDAAMEFDGSTGYITFPGVDLTNTDWWMSVWTYPITGIANKWHQPFGSVTGGYAFGYVADGSGNTGQIKATCTGIQDANASGWIPPLNSWSCLDVTYQKSTGTLTYYANGAEIMSTTFTPGFHLGALTKYVGNGLNNLAWWSGSLDEAAIYTYLPSLAQIQEHYQMGTQRFSYSPSGDLLLATGELVEGYEMQVLADKPVAFWPLSETSGTVAHDIAGGNNGTITGGVTLDQPGVLADGTPAMTFDGSTGYIAAPSTPSFIGLDALTCEAWVYPTSNSGDRTIFSASGEALHMWFSSYTAFRVSAGRSFYTVEGSPILLNTWHHLVGVYTGSAIDIYIDGTLNLSSTASGTVSATNNLNLGAYSPTSSSQWFAGTLALPAIYNYALTAEQIQAHYAAGKAMLTHLSSGDMVSAGELQEGAVL